MLVRLSGYQLAKIAFFQYLRKSKRLEDKMDQNHTTYNILDKVDSPKDIKGLSIGELCELCAEIRSYMIECCSINPGHLGSSLGAVELIVGLHYVYDAPQDKLVFDVGHQAYAHKIITGRREAFRKNRMKDGISGFLKRSESEYDAFGAGHSSTSISAALGFAEAAKQQKLGHKAVALIGDGSLTGGLAFEGLNNAGAAKTDILVILNDNNISIDRNIGAIHEYLLNITTDPRYNKAKKHIWDKLGDGRFRKLIQKMVVGTKSYLVRHSGGDLFEAMGFRYFGPIDGNDIEQVIRTLQKLKELGGPLILHTLTTKGKGYAPAEANQTVWHAPGIFDPETGERIKSEKGESRYQDVFGATLLELAKMNPKVVGITPAMASGCGMNILAKEMPDRFYDVGIEEEHAVTFSAGLAAGGMKPFCNIYSSFMQRAYDNVIHDVAIQKLNVVFCLDRAGLVGQDGPSHHGAFDLAYMRPIPNLTVASPLNEHELRKMMYTAQLPNQGPFVIRYPRGRGVLPEWKCPLEAIEIGKGRLLKEGNDIAVLTLGPIGNTAQQAIAKAEKQSGKSIAHYDLRFLKPLDEELLHEVGKKFKKIVTLEDGVLKGGMGSAILEFMADHGYTPTVKRIGIPDKFVQHGKPEELYQICGMDSQSIEIVLLSI